MASLDAPITDEQPGADMLALLLLPLPSPLLDSLVSEPRRPGEAFTSLMPPLSTAPSGDDATTFGRRARGEAKGDGGFARSGERLPMRSATGERRSIRSVISASSRSSGDAPRMRRGERRPSDGGTGTGEASPGVRLGSVEPCCRTLPPVESRLGVFVRRDLSLGHVPGIREKDAAVSLPTEVCGRDRGDRAAAEAFEAFEILVWQSPPLASHMFCSSACMAPMRPSASRLPLADASAAKPSSASRRTSRLSDQRACSTSGRTSSGTTSSTTARGKPAVVPQPPWGLNSAGAASSSSMLP